MIKRMLRFLLSPVFSVQFAILDGFGHMGCLDIGCAFQIGNCTRDLQHSTVSAHTHPHPLNSHMQNHFCFLCQGTVTLRQFRIKLRIAMDSILSISELLKFSSLSDTVADGC